MLMLLSRTYEQNAIEKDDMYLQLVSGVIVVNIQRRKIFIAERIDGEKRLLGKHTLLFTSHATNRDISSDVDIFTKTAERILTNDIHFYKQSVEPKPICYVRDIRSNLAEHIGLIHIVNAGKIDLLNTEKYNGFWTSYDDLKNRYYEKLDSWSRYILDYLYEDPVWHKALRFDPDGNIKVQN